MASTPSCSSSPRPPSGSSAIPSAPSGPTGDRASNAPPGATEDVGDFSGHWSGLPRGRRRPGGPRRSRSDRAPSTRWRYSGARQRLALRCRCDPVEPKVQLDQPAAELDSSPRPGAAVPVDREAEATSRRSGSEPRARRSPWSRYARSAAGFDLGWTASVTPAAGAAARKVALTRLRDGRGGTQPRELRRRRPRHRRGHVGREGAAEWTQDRPTSGAAAPPVAQWSSVSRRQMVPGAAWLPASRHAALA